MTIRYASRLPLFAALIAGMVCAGEAPAQDYPTRPITVIVPFAAGGLRLDVPARVLATMMLQEKIGQNIVVENKTGGQRHDRRRPLRHAPTPDGYTLLANSLADAQNLHFLTLTYSPVDDFSQDRLDRRRAAAGAAIVNAELPYKTLAELIADAKANPKQAQLRHIGAGLVARDGAGACSTRRPKTEHRRRALSWLGRSGSGRVRGPDLRACLRTIPRPSRWWMSARCARSPSRRRRASPAWPDVPTFQELGVNIDFRGFVGLVGADQDTEADPRAV